MRTGAAARGFTMIELIMVLLVISVVAAVALPRMFDRGPFEERAFVDQALAGLRYAQKLAIAGGCDVQVGFTAAGFSVKRRTGGCTAGAFTTDVEHPTRPGGFRETVPSGAAASPAVTVYFDRIGRPRDASGTLLGAPLTVTVGASTLTLEPETGYAHRS